MPTGVCAVGRSWERGCWDAASEQGKGLTLTLLQHDASELWSRPAYWSHTSPSLGLAPSLQPLPTQPTHPPLATPPLQHSHTPS